MPFRDPGDAAVSHFLLNIEDEWRWNGWQLKLDFQPTADIHIEFEPNTTPHVNGLGGNTIVMDSNQSLNEYDTQWTIRHEFGHVLGFPDCYIEFYEPDEDQMVNYQIDVDNLMCSRKGKLQQTHYDEMFEVYAPKDPFYLFP